MVALVAVFSCLSSAARANPAAPDCPATPACQALLTRGIKAFKDNHFEAALASFQRAHELVPDPRMLVFSGRAQFKLGRTQAALDLFERARPDVTEAVDRAKLDQYISEARASLPVVEKPVEPVAATKPEPPPKSERKLKPWAWALIGVGGAVVVGTAVGLGVYFGTSVPVPDATFRFPP